MLHDVRFNLISVQLLDDCGYDNHFGSSKWKLMARGDKQSKLYWTKALVAKDSECYVYGGIFVAPEAWSYK